MILMDGGLGRCFSHEVGTLMKEDSRRSLPPWALGRYNQKSAAQKGALPWPCQRPNLRCPASRLWEINLCCLQATHSGLCCYSSPNGVRPCNFKYLHLHRYDLYLRSQHVCKDNFLSHPALPSVSSPTSSTHRARKMWMNPCAETPET